MQATYSAKIDGRGRVTVPLEIRRWLKLSAGDRMEFVIEGELVVLRPLRPATLGSWARSPGARNR